MLVGDINIMNKTYLHKYTRILYYSFSLFILFLSMYEASTSSSVYYADDYIFLSVLAVSFILLNKYSIKLKYTDLNLNDFILIVCYTKFNIYFTVILIFLGYSVTFLIEYKRSKKLNLLTENVFIYNCSLVILSAFISHKIIFSLDDIYSIKSYEVIELIAYSIILLLNNYILYCFEISVQKWELTLITLENGLYYILLNFTICTVIASFAVYLFQLYGYMPIATMTAFIIFTSFVLNGLNKLKKSNNNLKAVSECNNFTISKGDFKIKLQNAIQTIEGMISFEYCGIYMIREKYDFLYPISYKCNNLTSLEDLKFSLVHENSIYSQLISGTTVYKEGKVFSSHVPLFFNYSTKIKYAAAVPLRTSEKVIGFVLLGVDRYLEIDEELKLVETLGSHIGMVNYHIKTNMKGNVIGYKNYDGLTRYIDYNIKHKIFFTLAVIEIENYKEIIQKYNSDFYESYKLELGRLISKFLSESDSILCFEKEDIYIVFNLLDSTNTRCRLQQIAEFLSSFKYKDLTVNTDISYACSEYPIDGASADEVLANIYRKLQVEKST